MWTNGIKINFRKGGRDCVYVTQETPVVTSGEQSNEVDWSLYTCLAQLYGGIDMYNLLHNEQLHISALFIGHLQVDK